MLGRRTKPQGFTLVELMVVILIIAMLIAILLPALARARAYARMAACSSNLRQVGIAVTNYAIEQDDKMPPVDRNIWHYLAPYIGENNKTNPGGDVFRCPVDPYKIDAPGGGSGTTSIPAAQGEAYSYAPNYAGTVGFTTVTLADADNDVNTPFTYDATGRLRRLGGTAPDTILFLESWGECVGDVNLFTGGTTINVGFDDRFVNRIMLAVEDWEKAPGTVGWTAGGGFGVAWHIRPAIQDYEGMNAIQVDPTSRKFEKSYGSNATSDHHWVLTMVATGENQDNAFHVGKVNLLAADGAVVQETVMTLAKTAPGADRRWTRTRD